MKKIFAIVLSALMILSMVACGGKETTAAATTKAAENKTTAAAQTTAEQTTEKKDYPETWISEEKITIKVGVQESATIEDWETNAQTLLLEEDLNIDLEFMILPADKGECLQKIELMILSGGNELPDVLMGVPFDLATITQYGQMGMFVDCTDYYATIADNTLASLELAGYELAERLAYVTSTDGNVYGVFGFADTVHNAYSNDMSFVYKPYLEKIGMEMPTTTDEFKEMLIKFRDTDLDGDGDTKDEYAYLSYKDNLKNAQIRYFMNPFIYTQEHYVKYNEKTQKVEFVANTDAWKEGIKWVKSLYDEGLYTTESMTQDAASFNAIVAGGDKLDTHVAVIGRISSSNLPATDKRRTEYALLNPLQGPDGEVNATKQPTLPSIRGIITKNAADPEACFKFFDYMCSEKISVWARYGEYGVDYTDAPAGSVGTFEKIGYPAKLKTITSWGVLQNKWWCQVGPNILPASWGSGQAAVVEEGNYASSCALAIGDNLKIWMDNVDPNPIWGMVYTEEEQEAITEFISTLDDYVLNTWAEFVTGVKDIDKDWDAYVKAFDNMGLEEVLDAMTSCYNRMFK